MAQDTTMNFQFTQLGVDLATKALAGTTKITFTKAVASSENHFSDTEATALALTTLGEVQQKIEIKTVMAVTDNKAQVKVPVVIDRGAITTDYSLLSIGLYAKDDDGTEVLYAVNGLQDAVEMRANAFGSTYSIDLYVAVGTSDNVTLTVDAAGMLPRTEFTAVMAEYMKIADMPKDLAYTDKANTFTEQQTLAGGAVDGAGNAIATTKNVSDGDAETLTSAKEYADTKISGKADDSKVVHTADMRKPASDVAGIDEVSTLQTQVNNSAVGTNLLIGTSEDELSGKSYAFADYQISGGLQPETTYTLSGWARVDQNSFNQSQNVLIFIYSADWSWTAALSIRGSLTSQYNKITFTAPAGKALAPNATVYLSHPNGDNSKDSISGTGYISKLKLEKGSKATDWCPNPEDKVNVADMRKPANDVAGIEEVNAKQDKLTITPADDSKVVHNSGDETIGGTKTFTNPIKGTIDGITYRYSAAGDDLDTSYMNDSVIYIGANQVAHAPTGTSGTWAIVRNYNSDATNGAQSYYDTSQGVLYVRTRNSNTTYTPWIQVADNSKVVHTADTSNWQKSKVTDDAGGPLLMLGDTDDLSAKISGLSNGYFTIYCTGKTLNNPSASPKRGIIHITASTRAGSGILFSEDKNAYIITMLLGTVTYTKMADDSKVAHLSGANNFDTTPTVNNNPLLLASSLPSDLARTGQANTFSKQQVFSTNPTNGTQVYPIYATVGTDADATTLIASLQSSGFSGLVGVPES